MRVVNLSSVLYLKAASLSQGWTQQMVSMEMDLAWFDNDFNHGSFPFSFHC